MSSSLISDRKNYEQGVDRRSERKWERQQGGSHLHDDAVNFLGVARRLHDAILPVARAGKQYRSEIEII
jgi:hypothetical protein